MKKGKVLIVLILCAIISTGCVKFNANMNIKKDKSMDFSIIYAFDKTVFGEDNQIKESDFDDLKKEGFTVNKYQEGNMEGVTLSKNYKNIDEVSTENENEYDLSGMMDSKKNKYMFKVEKGLLKNTYTAIIKFDANESGMTMDDENNEFEVNDEDDLPDENTLLTEDGNDISQNNSNSLDDMDLSQLTANLDMSFSVNLPCSAISSNATKTEDNNKKLIWTLNMQNQPNIEFKFALYNMNVIYIGAGVLALLILIVILLLLKNKNNKKTELAKVNDNQLHVKNETSNDIVSEPLLKNNTTIMEDNNQNNI